ncbi:hypothetical protein L2E82_35447 [Cichorium intybus]|uniref:Uncharacterized protein n=1 Tax=Cichorium intybus TaxID=13427 RepID=A0ACB9BNT2_CICIN|nr:hypothetical protein L2E82_35447 [Cichorium intybus]
MRRRRFFFQEHRSRENQERKKQLVDANSIAKEVGIDDIIAEAKPEDKAEKVKELQSSGLVVVMVGDGINDSPVW